jgi:MFS family permease
MLLVPGALLMLVLGPVSGIVGSRLGNKVPLAVGGFVTAAGLALLAVAHGSRLEVLVGATVMSAGIGFAYAAMPNLIIEAVPAHQTGEATGFNALIRSVGGSLGSQISATILAASAVDGVPADSGYRNAFTVSAVVAMVAGLVAIFIPRSTRHYHAPVLAEVGAAAPLAEPAYASEDFTHHPR